MASLRDQLVSKGLVSKKKAKQANRELKAQRKAAQGARKAKKVAQREAAAAREAEAAAAEQVRREQVAARSREREALEQRLRLRNLLLGNRMPLGRGQRFWHLSVDDPARLSEAQVSSGLAQKLRCGEAALARLDQRTGPEVVAIPRRTAAAVQEIEPGAILFFVENATGLGVPELEFHRRDWEPELRARRATEADVERWRSLGSGR